MVMFAAMATQPDIGLLKVYRFFYSDPHPHHRCPVCIEKVEVTLFEILTVLNFFLREVPFIYLLILRSQKLK